MAETVSNPEPAGEPALLQRLRSHFGSEPAALPVLEQQFAFYERPNLHLALQEMVIEPHRQAELLGVVVMEEYRAASLARLSRAASARRFDEGPVEYVDAPLPGDRHLACVK